MQTKRNQKCQHKDFFSVAFASQNWKKQKASHSSRTSKIFIQGTEAPWVRTFSPEISIGTMTSRDATNGFTKDLVQGVHVCPFTGPGDIHGPTHYLAWQHLLHLHFKKLTCRIMQNQIAVQPKNLQKFSEKKKNSKKTPLLSPSPLALQGTHQNLVKLDG